MNKICVCGLGKLGACIAASFAAAGIQVIGLDIDRRKIEAVMRGRAPVQENGLQYCLESKLTRDRLRATSSVHDAVNRSEACLFVTLTPSNPDGSFDHSQLLAAIKTVAKEVERQQRRDYLFVINSTVMPTFIDRCVVPLLEQCLGTLKYRLAYKPEFIAIGTVMEDLCYPDFALIGAATEESASAVEQLYLEILCERGGVSPPFKRMSFVEAELAKISLNCAVTAKISYANQIGLIAKKLGADPHVILDAVGEDRRVGHAGLKPGLPFGGPCFPRDGRMLLCVASQVGEAAPVTEGADVMNRRVLRNVIDSVPKEGDVGILGMAYKPGTWLTEESAGSKWRHMLVSAGRRVICHDPKAEHSSPLEEVLLCHTLIVACPWPEYETLTVPHGTVLIDPWGVVKNRIDHPTVSGEIVTIEPYLETT